MPKLVLTQRSFLTDSAGRSRRQIPQSIVALKLYLGIDESHFDFIFGILTSFIGVQQPAFPRALLEVQHEVRGDASIIRTNSYYFCLLLSSFVNVMMWCNILIIDGVVQGNIKKCG